MQNEIDGKFSEIANKLFLLYHNEMTDFLASNSGLLQESEVVLMIMNLTASMTSYMYFSLKKFLPRSELDFDFIRAKLINELSVSFEKIKSYSPDTGFVQLTDEEVTKIMEEGSINMTLSDGACVTVKKEHILVKKTDIDKTKEEMNVEPSTSSSVPPSTNTLQ